MVGIAQLVERGIVVPEVMGSSPVTHPFAPVAQLDRASDFESEGRRFESYRVYGVSSCGCIAQLAEHRTLNPQVEGSIPSTPTSKKHR